MKEIILSFDEAIPLNEWNSFRKESEIESDLESLKNSNKRLNYERKG